MSFSIIIPSRNLHNLLACCGAIRAAGETARIIVVWDGSEGPLADGPEASKLYALANSIWHTNPPFCFARSVNIGIRAADSDGIVLLNDDALVPAHSNHPLLKLVDAAEMWGVGVLSPRVTSPAALQHSYPAAGCFPGRIGKEMVTDITRFRMVPFVCVAIRREVISQVGMLDERFCGSALVAPGGGVEPWTVEVYGGEDDDYCYRVRQEGYRIGVLNTWVLDHSTLKSTFRPDGKGRSVAGARQRFFEIHGFGMGTR